MLDAAGLPYDWHLPSKPGASVPRSALAGVVAPADKCATPLSLPLGSSAGTTTVKHRHSNDCPCRMDSVVVLVQADMPLHAFNFIICNI